jgi:hypothetical protein
VILVQVTAAMKMEQWWLLFWNEAAKVMRFRQFEWWFHSWKQYLGKILSERVRRVAFSATEVVGAVPAAESVEVEPDSSLGWNRSIDGDDRFHSCHARAHRSLRLLEG